MKQKKMHFYQVLKTTLLILLINSCAKEEFATKKVKDTSSAPIVQQKTELLCANHTLVKPKVDFLFLWDNSTSQYFVNTQTKEALKNTIQLVSNRFDYHIFVVPLVGVGNTNSFLVAENPTGLTTEAMNLLTTNPTAQIDAFETSSSSEQGLKRAVDVLKANVNNGIFRKNAYTIIVTMSNGDDIKKTLNGQIDAIATDLYIETQKTALLDIRNNLLKSEQMRFITLAAFSVCDTGFRQNYSYKKMSQKIYSAPYSDGRAMPTDQNNDTSPDAYDICGLEFTHLFDGINNSIFDVVIKHVYDAWPISNSQQLTFNPEKITVRKNTGEEYLPVSGPGMGDGFRYIGYQTRNTRLLPTPGEPYTGHLIELYEGAKVTYPECLIIETESPIEYFAYVALSAKPVLSTIKLKINGVDIPQSNVNGWEYIGYKQSQNLKIMAPNDYTEAFPALYKTGHILKLYGSAIYKNGSSLNIIYDPSGN